MGLFTLTVLRNPHTQTGKAIDQKLVDVPFNKKSKSKFTTIGKKPSDFFAKISCW